MLDSFTLKRIFATHCERVMDVNRYETLYNAKFVYFLAENDTL